MRPQECTEITTQPGLVSDLWLFVGTRCCPLRLVSESLMAMACFLLLSCAYGYYGRAPVEALSENL